MEKQYYHLSGNGLPRRGRRRRHVRRRRRSRFPGFFLFILIILLLLTLAWITKKWRNSVDWKTEKGRTSASETIASEDRTPDASKEGDFISDSEETSSATSKEDEILSEAELKFLQYDYDAAIELIKEYPALAESEAGSSLIARCEAIKPTLVRQDISQITHVFFHTLIMDTAKAFDGDSRQNGYNEVMTTKSEFEKMMQEMYQRGYVLVRIHDVAYEVDDSESGGKKMETGSILLPEGKKAFVLSQDDVNYYEYMDGDGFAKNLSIGADGKPINEMLNDDGTITTGAFDMVPILNDFIQEHPDFSYRGAKGILAVTGYNGVFGYRTDPSYEGKNPDIEADRQRVREVAQCLRDDGWELASHSWGHRNYGKISMDELREDNRKWQERVGSLIGGTDILIYPFGADVADWHPYKNDNARFRYLWDSGFRYFCNVDSSPYFVQKGNDFLRMGRRNLDGYRMWQDMTVKNHTTDLFNAADIFDPARPTPVPSYQGG